MKWMKGDRAEGEKREIELGEERRWKEDRDTEEHDEHKGVKVTGNPNFHSKYTTIFVYNRPFYRK